MHPRISDQSPEARVGLRLGEQGWSGMAAVFRSRSLALDENAIRCRLFSFEPVATGTFEFPRIAPYVTVHSPCNTFTLA